VTKIKLNLINNPNKVYKKIEVDNYNDDMRLEPLSINPFQNFRRPINYFLKDAKILGLSNLILNNKNECAINNIVFNTKNNDKIFHESETNLKINKDEVYFDYSKEENIKKGIFLGSHWNYGHWLFNHVARLYYCQSNIKENLIIVNKSIDEDKFQILKYFNIPEEKIKIIDRGTLLKVDELIIPQIPWHSLNGQVWWSPNSFNFIRENLGINKVNFKETKLNIFITRSSARWRKVLNEEKLFNISSKFNFKLIDVGKLSVHEQVNLGKQTKNLISPLGANSNFFINLPKNAKFIELAPPIKQMNVSGSFSNASGIKYLQIIGKPEKENINNLDINYSINETEFLEKIKLFFDLDN